MTDPISIIVPARNEAATIRKVVETLSAMAGVGEVVVVENGSSDDTGDIAKAAGARMVYEPKPGMGSAVKAGFAAARHDWVMKVDADLDKFDTSLFARMPEARETGVGLIKGAWNDPDDNMPMTRLLVMPAIRQMFPGLGKLRAPNSGLYLFDRSLIALGELTDGYAVDLDVMMRVHAAGAAVSEVDIGRIAHDTRDVQHYNQMAETIMGFFLERHEKQILRETVVLAQTAEQVICSALGLLAARSKHGACVTVYLAQHETDAARALGETLAPFPTAQVRPLVEAGAFKPRRASAGLQVFGPYPVAGEEVPLMGALKIVQANGGALPDLLMMPHGPERAVVDGFKADMSVEIGSGAAAKQETLARTGLSATAGGVPRLPRELFQSYQSLPDVLKQRLWPNQAGPEANTM